MPSRKNAGRLRPQQSPSPVPAAVPFGGEPIPPSPPLFMLDDHDDFDFEPPIGSAGPRSPSPTHSLFDQQPEPDRSHADHQPHDLSTGTAHKIAPTIASETSVMDQIAQAVRYMYPSSSSHSSVQRDQPKRRPVSFGGFLGGGRANRRGNVGSLISTSLSPLLTPLNVAASSSSRPIPELTSEDEEHSAENPAELDLDNIHFSTWSTICVESNNFSHFLILGYEQGFQIWDTTQLDSIKEVVHVRNEEPFNDPVFGAALAVVTKRPLAGNHLLALFLVGRKGDMEASFAAYCMTTQRVMAQFNVPGAMELQVNSEVVAISTVRPPAIHLFSLRDFSEVEAIGNVASRPTFVLSNRLLAYASPPPTEQDQYKYSKTPIAARSPQSISSLGSAYKVGHGILSGMRALGSIAAAATSPRIPSPEKDNEGAARLQGQNFSRSAPAASLLGSMSPKSGPITGRHGSQPSISPLITPVDHIAHEGTWLTIIDLTANPEGNEVHRFRVSGSKPITRLEWGSDGSTLYCATSGGQTVYVYSIRPEGVLPLSAPMSPGGGMSKGKVRSKSHNIGVPWHLYDLHRGHSAANILSIVPSHDSRWVAACTQRGTVHVFATNPYGGPANVPSHMKGKVMNPGTLQPLSTPLLPLLRIRPSSASTNAEEGDPTPIAMRFLTLEESLDLPSHIAPKLQENVQDLLVFQPLTGVLELFRITVDVLEQSQTTGSPSGRTARMTNSPRLQPVTSALTRLIDKGQALRAKDSSVATWDLRRRKDWPDVRQIFPIPARASQRCRILGDNWLAYAEIDTFSRSTRILPPPIYLSHQFTFHAFMEDYEALLRSGRFGVPTEPITVRNEVQISAYATDLNDSVMHADDYDLGEPRHHQRQAKLHDPMVAAIAEELEYTQSPPIAYPMLPNGASLSSNASRSLLESIPIKRGAHLAMEITGGVGEGLGKLRREIAKVRSPSMRPVADTPEIQELEDEELLDADPDAGSSRMTSEAEASLRTPEGGRDDRELADPWDEWGVDEQEAVAEAERFDEIYPAGEMDEDCDEAAKRSNGSHDGRGNGNGNGHAGGDRGGRRAGRKAKRMR